MHNKCILDGIEDDIVWENGVTGIVIKVTCDNGNDKSFLEHNADD